MNLKKLFSRIGLCIVTVIGGAFELFFALSTNIIVSEVQGNRFDWGQLFRNKLLITVFILHMAYYIIFACIQFREKKINTEEEQIAKYIDKRVLELLDLAMDRYEHQDFENGDSFINAMNKVQDAKNRRFRK